MDASLSKTQRVLHLVQPSGDRQFQTSFEPSNLVTFTNRPPGLPLNVAADDEPVLFQIPWSLWTDLGRPDDVTITVREGDTLND